MALAKGREIKLSTDTGFLKLIAIVSMAIDHAGKMLFPAQPWMRLVGRLAFPLFAYCLAVGVNYTRNAGKYALRVLSLALICQPIYALAMGHVTSAMNGAIAGGLTLRSALSWYALSMRSANILFSLFAGIVLLWSLKEQKYIAAAVVTLAVWKFSNCMDYGWKGVVLMALFWALMDRPVSSLCWVGGFMAWWGITGGSSYHLGPVSFSSQAYALFALPFIYVPTRTGIKLPKWFFYAFYPFHLIVIYAVLQMR